jgi:polysaccharide biosynthesis protein PslG
VTLRADAAPPRPVPALTATPRLWVGFLDDQAFRWERPRKANLARARRQGASVIRTIVDWSFVARRQPRRPADPFAPEYRLHDVDELVRNAEARGLEVLLTIWGTPRWANGGEKKNVAPDDPRDLREFARALADRYSGRHPGYPFVRFYTVWNEPNAEQFLSPQFDAAGRPLAPATYAALFRAAYDGIKSASPRALVAAGETAARGKDRPGGRVQDSESPARFARLVAAAAPDLRFDAWAHHPYPRSDRTKPGAPQPWPAVGLGSLGRFGAALGRWFDRDPPPLWLSEFAYRTSPEIRGAASYEQQAAYLERTVELVRAQPSVAMLVWFVFRDMAGEPWQSGLVDRFGRAKPALASFAAASVPAARQLEVTADPTSPVLHFGVPALELRSHLGPGERVAVSYTLASCGRLVSGGRLESRIGADGWVPVTSGFAQSPGSSFRLSLELQDVHGGRVLRQVAVRGAAGEGATCARP